MVCDTIMVSLKSRRKIDMEFTTTELASNIELNTRAIPSLHSKMFKTLFHGTTVEEALALLSNGEITGDGGLHANFAIKPRPDLARSSEVFLMFEFEGLHRAAISWVGKKRPYFTKYADNVVFHIYTTNTGLDITSDFLNDYWQTIIFPGTKGLKFLGIHEPVNSALADKFSGFVGKEIAIKGYDIQWHFKDIPAELYEAAQTALKQ